MWKFDREGPKSDDSHRVFDFGVQFDLSNSEKWYSHGPQHITKHAYANPLLPAIGKTCGVLDAFEEQAFGWKA